MRYPSPIKQRTNWHRIAASYNRPWLSTRTKDVLAGGAATLLFLAVAWAVLEML